MVISQILYLSLLQYNHVQSLRYQGLIDYYQGQIQMMMAQDISEITDKVTQFELALNEIMAVQQQNLLRQYQVLEQIEMHPQVKILRVKNALSEERLVVMEHRIYLDEHQVFEMELPEKWLVDGVLLTNKTYKDWSQANLDSQLLPILEEIKDLSYITESTVSRNYQGQIIFERPKIQQIHFNEGMIEFKNGLSDLELIAHPNGVESSNLYRKKLPLQTLPYLIRSKITVFK